MPKLWALFKAHREGILYLFFGGCTTLVNFVVYWACTRVLPMGTVAASVWSWLLSVLFAYATNRKWVFESTASGMKAIVARRLPEDAST
jgi:putative flippase GtrA